jgi:DNA repair exonuclease SbcCD nuclease subunit
MLTLIHTADVHLGVKFRRLGVRAADMTDLPKKAFTKVCDLAISRHANALLIAGDLFDSNTVSESLVRFAEGELARVCKAGVRVVLTAGTHDRLDGGSVLTQMNFPSGAHVLTPEKPQIDFRDIDLTVCGFSNTFNKSVESPLSKLSVENGCKYKVAMVHASVAIDSKHAPDDYPVTSSEIEKSEFDYIAFGHWHRAQEILKNKAWYSGSPETLKLEDEGSGKALVVTLGDEGINIEPVQIGQIIFDAIDVAVDGVVSANNLQKKILGGANPMLSRTVTLSGVILPNQFIDVAALTQDTRDSFFALKILDKTTVQIDESALALFPDELVIGKFVRILQSEIASEQDAGKKKRLEKALQLGVALIQGKEVL